MSMTLRGANAAQWLTQLSNQRFRGFGALLVSRVAHNDSNIKNLYIASPRKAHDILRFLQNRFRFLPFQH
jgi:hypothetical protein